MKSSLSKSAKKRLRNKAKAASGAPAPVPVPRPKSAKAPQAAQPQAARPFQGALGTLGAGVGGYFGGPAGAAVGKAAGDLIGSVVGFGDYTVTSNTLGKTSTTLNGAVQAPLFRSKMADTVLQHRELVGVVKGSKLFRSTEYTINPGHYKTFAWLSGVAKQYEEYQFNGLVFTYVPTSGMVTAGQSLGSVMMVTQYDAAENPLSSKREVDAYQFACTTVPFNSCYHPVECAPASGVLQRLYVHPPGQDMVHDPRFYHLGIFQVCTEGMPNDDDVLGEVWVSYDVSLSKPRLSPNFADTQTLVWKSALHDYAHGWLIGPTNFGVVSPPYPAGYTEYDGFNERAMNWLSNPNGANGILHLPRPGYYSIAIISSSESHTNSWDRAGIFQLAPIASNLELNMLNLRASQSTSANYDNLIYYGVVHVKAKAPIGTVAAPGPNDIYIGIDPNSVVVNPSPINCTTVCIEISTGMWQALTGGSLFGEAPTPASALTAEDVQRMVGEMVKESIRIALGKGV